MKNLANGRDIAVAMLLVFSLTTCQAASDSADQDVSNPEGAALLAALPKSKMTLADGLKFATVGAEAPISARFELDENKNLMLSVYTAGGGFAVAAEYNLLEELNGSAEQERWMPRSTILKDKEHLSRASEYLVLSALSHRSLLDVVNDAAAQRRGTVFSITPVLRESKPVFIVLVAEKGKVSELDYDISTGSLLSLRQ